MKLFVRLLSAAMLIGLLNSCEKIKGEGPVVTQSRPITGFSAVSNTISGTVNYKQDNAFKVELIAQQNILDVIKTDIINNELVIRFKDGVNVKKHEPITINVSSPSVTSLRVSGSGNLVVAGPIASGNFSLTVSGSGNIIAGVVDADELNATISGSGGIQVPAGVADIGKLRISGSGEINMTDLTMREVVTTTSGSGSMRFKATEKLNVTISGSGSVYYKGSPVVSTSISGSGRVVHVD